MCTHITSSSIYWGAPDVACAQHGYLATSMGEVLCCRLDLSSPTGHLCECSYVGGNISAPGARRAFFWTSAPPVAFSGVH